MQVFCKETQAQLDLNPDLKVKGRSTEDELITPDLWMKNCRSRSLSPDDRSTGSETTSHASEHRISLPSKKLATKTAPAFELMTFERKQIDMGTKRARQQNSQKENENDTDNFVPYSHQQRLLRKRRIQRHSTHSTNSNGPNHINDDEMEQRNRLSVRKLQRSSGDKFTTVPQTSPDVIPVTALIDDPLSNIRKIPLVRLANFSQNMPQTANTNALHAGASTQNVLRQATRFAGHPIATHTSTLIDDQSAKTAPPPLPPSVQSDTTTTGDFPNMQPKPSVMQSTNWMENLFNGRLPNPTILVPYPIVLPIPLPIPIPLPYEVFLKAFESNGTAALYQRAGGARVSSTVDAMHFKNAHTNDQPLDFSKQSSNTNSPKHCDYDDIIDTTERIK